MSLSCNSTHSYVGAAYSYVAHFFSKETAAEEQTIAVAFMGEAVFTNSEDEKPAIATEGCGPCVALGGYDSINKMGFIIHFSLAESVPVSGDLIFDNISKLAVKPITKPIQLHLRGGVKGHSEKIIELIKVWMKERDDLPMQIISEDILVKDCLQDPKSLFIDTRTGEVSEYESRKDPNQRKMTLSLKDVENHLATRKITVHYSPDQKN